MSEIHSIEYRRISEFLKYKVGSDGTVWSSHVKGSHWKTGPWWKMRQIILGSGACRVIVYKKGKPVRKMVHRLILEAFVGPCPEGMECCHNDGNPANNNLTNLRWDTHKNNYKDSVRHGTWVHGECHGNAKFTDGEIRRIRKLARLGYSSRRLAGMYDVARITIKRIVHHIYWRHIK